MTETSPIVTVARKENYKVGSCGVLVANTKGKIVDLDTGKALGPNERGELCVKGPQVILNLRKKLGE
jgi:long-subunit acyl-CoA synthetase (AMP-forming)